ncbi:MAG: DNA polymerase III subunit alpha [Bdellovibrionota bacterium]
MSFVHLHVHSQFSLLKSTVRIDKLFEMAKAGGMPAVALTDYGNLHGSGEFLEKAKASGVQPILGLDISVVHGPASEKSTKYPSYGLVLLAKNAQGLQNLHHLVSLAHLEGFYYKPRVDLDMLEKYHEGLIALSGNHFGGPARMIQDHRLDAAEEMIQQYVKIFGKDDYYLELIDTGLKIQETINNHLIEFSKKLGVKLIATNDVHYLDQKDSHAHDVMLCIGSGKQLDDPGRLKYQTDEFYFRSAEEMKKKFAGCPEAITNTLEIAEKCKLNIKHEGYHMPRFELPAGQTAESFLEKISREGLNDRLAKMFAAEHTDPTSQEEIRKKYFDRLDVELDCISKVGFASYFLIVSDFIYFAKNNGIPVGPGRGSAAGSIVAYATRITDVDPIPYNLLFERFLNPERISMPDIDVDFCQYRRDEVIKYVSNKYDGEGVGEKRVAQICTFGKLQARAAIRDVGRVMAIPYGDVDRIAKLVPTILNISLEEAFEQEPKFAEIRKDPKIDELLNIALFLEGMPRHASVHAAGVVISDEKPLVDHLPLMRGQEGEIVTQWDMKGVEKIGLVKLDFLGLKTLTLLQRAVELIKSSKGKEIDLLYIDMKDPKVFELLSRGDTQGIFQLESSGMRDIVTKLKPSSFEDIVALVALYRPGPLGSGMVDDFINRKHGRTPIVYDLPQLEKILKETYGVILYQEQVMQIASELASYTLGEADLLRRAMGKKIPEEMAKQKDRFLQGARKNNIPEGKAQRIFDLMEKFAGYGFNKSHSAAYALISYQTAYLKTHFPVEFMAACLSIDRSNSDRVVLHLSDCRKQNIDVLPPDINESDLDFRVVDQSIRFGLAAIKNVGDIAIQSVLDTRNKDGKFKDLFDLCKRVELRQVNKKVLEALIKCGAFDSLQFKRSQLMLNLEKILEMASKDQKDERVGQSNLFGGSGATKVQMDQAEEWDESQRLRFEKESVGFYITGHPLLKYQTNIDLFSNSRTSELIEKRNQSTVRMGGIVSTLKEITTKKGARMAFATLEDLQGQTEVILFPEVYSQSIEMVKSEQPLYLIGKVDVGEEQAKVIAEKVCYLEQAETVFEGKVHIFIDASNMQDDDLNKLKQLMTKHKGTCCCASYDHRWKISDHPIASTGLCSSSLHGVYFRTSNADSIFQNPISKRFGIALAK